MDGKLPTVGREWRRSHVASFDRVLSNLFRRCRDRSRRSGTRSCRIGPRINSGRKRIHREKQIQIVGEEHRSFRLLLLPEKARPEFHRRRNSMNRTERLCPRQSGGDLLEMWLHLSARAAPRRPEIEHHYFSLGVGEAETASPAGRLTQNKFIGILHSSVVGPVLRGRHWRKLRSKTCRR